MASGSVSQADGGGGAPASVWRTWSSSDVVSRSTWVPNCVDAAVLDREDEGRAAAGAAGHVGELGERVLVVGAAGLGLEEEGEGGDAELVAGAAAEELRRGAGGRALVVADQHAGIGDVDDVAAVELVPPGHLGRGDEAAQAVLVEVAAGDGGRLHGVEGGEEGGLVELGGEREELLHGVLEPGDGADVAAEADDAEADAGPLGVRGGDALQDAGDRLARPLDVGAHRGRGVDDEDDADAEGFGLAGRRLGRSLLVDRGDLDDLTRAAVHPDGGGVEDGQEVEAVGDRHLLRRLGGDDAAVAGVAAVADRLGEELGPRAHRSRPGRRSRAGGGPRRTAPGCGRPGCRSRARRSASTARSGRRESTRSRRRRGRRRPRAIPRRRSARGRRRTRR